MRRHDIDLQYGCISEWPTGRYFEVEDVQEMAREAVTKIHAAMRAHGSHEDCELCLILCSLDIQLQRIAEARP
jgi:hypothetical protein